MNCKIADLGVSVPDMGDLPERCKPYESDIPADIKIEDLCPDKWKTLNEADNYYLDSGFQFYRKLLDFDGCMLHSSAVVVDGYAYLFSGPCGMGKSTHTQKHLKAFPDAVIINDDKPALRRIDGRWIVYGTPWCGKDGINANMSAPLAGICFLHRGDRLLRRPSILEALPQFLNQTTGRRTAEDAAKLMELLGKLLQEVPVFEFYNHAEEGDEQLTYKAMRDAIGRRNDTI